MSLRCNCARQMTELRVCSRSCRHCRSPSAEARRQARSSSARSWQLCKVNKRARLLPPFQLGISPGSFSVGRFPWISDMTSVLLSCSTRSPYHYQHISYYEQVIVICICVVSDNQHTVVNLKYWCYLLTIASLLSLQLFNFFMC